MIGLTEAAHSLLACIGDDWQARPARYDNRAWRALKRRALVEVGPANSTLARKTAAGRALLEPIAPDGDGGLYDDDPFADADPADQEDDGQLALFDDDEDEAADGD